MSSAMSMSMRVKLSVMMFIQFMMLPVWFIPMFPYVQAMEGGSAWAFWCGLIMAFGAVTSPLFGMVADRFFSSEKVLAFCNVAGAALLGYAYTVKDPAVLFFVLAAVMLVYMPTWSLTATIAMENSTTEAFPSIRVFGSLGWVAAAVFSIVATKMGMANFDATPFIFLAGAGVSLVGAVLAFVLPNTPPKAKGQPMSIGDALGLRAFVLFKRADFAVFAILILLAMVPFQWYNVYTSMYLKEQGFKALTVTMNIGQAFEIFFMLMIPVILKKAGYKWGMVLALATLTLRYVFFYGATMGCGFCNYGGILVHGLIFGMLIVGSQMYVDATAPAELRGQAQGLMGLIMFGVGTVLSNFTFDKILAKAEFIEKLTEKVTEVDAGGAIALEKVVEVTKHNWQPAFLIALVMAAVLMVAMAVLFNPKKTPAK